MKGIKRFVVIFKASENGHVDVVELLLENGANINERDYYENTPLIRGYNFN